MSDPSSPSAGVSEERDVQREAYEQHLPELRKIQPEQLVPINVDVGQAISTGLATVEQIKELRPRIALLAHEVDIQLVDQLESRTYALSYAHGDYLMATTKPESLPQVQQEAVELRDFLLASAQMLSKAKLLPEEQFNDLKGSVGYRNTAQDLTALSKAHMDSWDAIAGKTAVTLAQVQRASALAALLFRGAGVRDRSPAGLAETTLIRQQAFTAFIESYDQVVRSVTFLFWGKPAEVERVSPSLYAGRGNGGRRKPEDTTPQQPGAPTPTQPPVSTTPANHADGANTQATGATDAGQVPTGHRGGQPYA
jgi:hypothetical protein